MIIYGKQLFLHVLEKYPNKLIKVQLSKKCDPKLFSKIKRACLDVSLVDNMKAQALCHGGNHQGFIAHIEDITFTDFNDIKKSSFVLILQGITDVGNIGAIIRSAYVFGADAVIISGIKSINLEALIRTSSAAIFEIPIVLESNTLDLINELKQVGFKIYGADMNGKDVKGLKFSPKKALMMGSEGEGIPSKVKSKLDEIVSIKMAREFDSLNVGAATAILCDRIFNG
ncbi:MAG: 23S rRNA (guanosine(2251)-2'-O)-methyltransferase RlmB [Sulfurospirillaceae bacterium]|nr:23S rRNA (guanosine(2251)-2'-O)-methyltransferase RlmB [Sulfurospirillaceae bacterium]